MRVAGAHGLATAELSLDEVLAEECHARLVLREIDEGPLADAIAPLDRREHGACRRRPGDRLNVTAGERGDAAEPTDEIQHGALDREDRPQVAQKPPQDLTGSAGFAIAASRLEPHITLEYFKQSRDDRQTGGGPGLPRHPRRSHIPFVMDDALCGDIPAVGKVLRPGCAQKSIQRPIRGER